MDMLIVRLLCVCVCVVSFGVCVCDACRVFVYVGICLCVSYGPLSVRIVAWCRVLSCRVVSCNVMSCLAVLFGVLCCICSCCVAEGHPRQASCSRLDCRGRTMARVGQSSGEVRQWAGYREVFKESLAALKVDGLNHRRNIHHRMTASQMV